MSKYKIPSYDYRTEGYYFGKCFKYYIVDTSDNDRFIGGSCIEEDMLIYYEILTNGNWDYPNDEPTE